MQFVHLQICKTCVSSLSFSVIGPHRQSIYKHKSSSQCHRHQVPAKGQLLAVHCEDSEQEPAIAKFAGTRGDEIDVEWMIGI